MADNDSGISSLGWFLAGLGIGALAGVLYAPKSGKETREDILNGAIDAKDKAAELVEQGKQKAAEYVEQGKQLAAEYVDQGKQRAAEIVEEGKKTARESIDKGREYYDKGRTQWTQYVEKGKGLLHDQQEKASAVDAAVDAGKEAYATTESPV